MEWEKAWAEAHVMAAEELFDELIHRPFQMAEIYVFVDVKSFDLVEHRRVRYVRIGAVGAAH